MIALGNHRHLIAVEPQIAVRLDPTARQHVAADDPVAVSVGRVAYIGLAHDTRNRRARDHLVVTRLEYLGPGQRDDLAQIDPARAEEAADQRDVLNIDGPHDLALADGIHVVYLHADVACRMRSAEIVLLDPLYLLQHPFRRVGVESQTYGTGRQLRKHGEAEVQIVQLLLERETHVGPAERCRSPIRIRTWAYSEGRL